MMKKLQSAKRLPSVEMSTISLQAPKTLESQPSIQQATKLQTAETGQPNSGFVTEVSDALAGENQPQAEQKGSKRIQGSMDFLTLNDASSDDHLRRQSSASQFSHFSTTDFSASQQQDSEHQESLRRRFHSNDNYIQDQVPVLPIPAATCVLVCNIIVPGLGTILSGLLFLCLSRPEQRKALGWFEPVCVNCWVGLSQLLTITFLLVGWGWSIAWGVYAVQKALDQRDERERKRRQEIAERALHALMGQDLEHSASGGGGGLANFFRRGK